MDRIYIVTAYDDHLCSRLPGFATDEEEIKQLILDEWEAHHAWADGFALDINVSFARMEIKVTSDKFPETWKYILHELHRRDR